MSSRRNLNDFFAVLGGMLVGAVLLGITGAIGDQGLVGAAIGAVLGGVLGYAVARQRISATALWVVVFVVLGIIFVVVGVLILTGCSLAIQSISLFTVAIGAYLGFTGHWRHGVSTFTRWFHDDRSRNFVLTLLISLLLGTTISVAISWEFWHGVAFTAGLTTLVYTAAVWMGSEPSVRFQSPGIGLPILLILGLVVWWAHFGDGQYARPITLMIQVAMIAPFATETLFAMVKKD